MSDNQPDRTAAVDSTVFDVAGANATGEASANPRRESKPGATIVLDEVTKQYPGQRDPAVESISMTIPAGEIVVLVGPSGCGKTTTMKMINRLIEPTSGRILIDDTDVLKLDVDTHRRQVGYVIQQTGLLPHMTVADNVALVPRMLKWSKQAVRDRVDELLELVGLPAGEYGKRYPRQLSGGQQQRIGVARALAADPPVMLMDEPFGATDPITREHLQDEFLRLQRDLRKTIVFVTHDFSEALKMGDRIAVLREQSVIAQYDTPTAILAEPADDYVGSFIGSGGQLQRLSLMPIADTTLRPVPDNLRGAREIISDATLRDCLDVMLETGHDRVVVVDEYRDNAPRRGMLTLDDLMESIHDDGTSEPQAATGAVT